MDSHLISENSGVAAEEKTNLWETVLREVGSSKNVATKNVLVLGDSNSGKTGVVTQLFQASLRPQFGNGQDTAQTSMSTGLGGLSEPTAETESSIVSLSKHDLSLSYSYMDVRDEDNEETVARVGIYQLASDKATDCELLKFVLDARSFPDSAAVVVLDWSRPWRFVKSLLRWLNVLSRAVDMVGKDTDGREATSQKGSGGWTLGKATVDECRERLERFLQEYSESADASSAAAADTAAAAAAFGATNGNAASANAGRYGGAGNTNAAAKAADVLLPLGKGMLENNLGIPLVVVCTKSDAMSIMERERGFKEEDFDYIQQILRAICLRYGAALIYTSTHSPTTFSTLYHYLVHRLLSGPTTVALSGTEAESQMNGDLSEEQSHLVFSRDNISNATESAHRETSRIRSDSTSAPGASTSNNKGNVSKQSITYPFRVRANVVDRDVVFVPAGWDSAAKIGFLREPFDVHAIQNAWRLDEGRYSAIVNRAVREAAATVLGDGVLGNHSDDGLQTIKPDSNTSILLMFGETVPAPKQRSGVDIDGGSTVAAVTAAAAGMANQVFVEDDQTFFERLFAEQQEQMAIEGEEVGDLSALQQHDAYTDGRLRMGGSSNKLISSLLRSVNNAESSLSTVSDMADAVGGSLSDEEGGEMDRADSGNGMTSFSSQRLPTMPPTLVSSGSSHARMDSDDNFGGSLGRASGNRATSRQATQSGQVTSATVDQPAAPANTLRRKLTLTAGNGSSVPKESSGGTTAASNEDLTSFFNNLLGRKGGAASSATSSTGKSSPQQTARPLGGSQSRATGAGNRDIQADLERLKAQARRNKEQ
ncbi:hypothetical protein EDC05_004950 [Coemansia umbellata]|uniref:Dynein light intermediate chain n=1 Tax=Coemansia umbellata TaxID=1424467 RepID=A0ABQ8PJ22_9FUNG|nr:hypothetical protein EDC05_004950 [Coemansia umbellata]